MDRFLDELRKSYDVKVKGTGILLSTPIMYYGADRTFSFYISRDVGEGFIISDMGRTMDYLSENTDPKIYRKKIEGIAKAFNLVIYENELRGVISSYESRQTQRALHLYFLGIGIIANLDLLP